MTADRRLALELAAANLEDAAILLRKEAHDVGPHLFEARDLVEQARGTIQRVERADMGHLPVVLR